MGKKESSNEFNSVDDFQNNDGENILLHEKLEKTGLNYINKQENYLIMSLIFPVVLSILQLLNIIFLLIIEADRDSELPLNIFILTIILSPVLFFFMISALGLTIFMYLIAWKRKVTQYKNQIEILTNKKEINQENGFPRNTVTLTNIFYDIVKTMKSLRIIFLILAGICTYHFYWIFSFFFIRRLPREPFQLPYDFPIMLFSIFIGISQLVLFVYFVYELRHFIRWNKKLKKLGKFEKRMYSELFESNNNTSS